MNRAIYFDYIEKNLNYLAFRILQLGKINLLDLNLHSETFFADLLNVVYGFTLRNLNAKLQNAEGVDLVDEKNKIIVQVSSICTKQKIEASLEKDFLVRFKGYRFKYMSIARNAGNLGTKSYTNPHNVIFLPEEDIIDINVILRHVLSMTVDKQKTIYEFVKKELGDDPREGSFHSNLATLIDILAREDLSDVPEHPEIKAHNIEEKIIYNNLEEVKDLIDEYKVYYSRLNGIYSEFDKQGNNKSISVFRRIKRLYIYLSNE